VESPGQNRPNLRLVNGTGRDYGQRDSNAKPKPPPFLNVPPIVKYTALALVVIHVVLYLAGNAIYNQAIIWLSFSTFRTDPRLGWPNAFGNSAWTTLTYSLLHNGFSHLIFNVLWLIVFGTPVARRLSAQKFLLIAATGSVGGALLTLLLNWNTFVIVIGASASVSALLAAAVPIMFGPGNMIERTGTERSAKSALVMPFRDLLRNQQAIVFMIFFIVITLMTGAVQHLGGGALVGGGSIAWAAHLGGFIAGLLAYYWLDDGPVHGKRRL
jgi:membrane associated rhomboid family serine protease